MEGYDAQRLKQGGANAETFTLSFYAKAVGKTGVYSVCCIKKDAGGAGRYQVKEFTVTTSWVRHTITFEADTTALIRNSNSGDLNFYFSMACGPDDKVAPTTAWAAGGGVSASTNQVNFMDSTSNEFHITGVQLEIGSTVTPFESKTYAQELQACLRYFEKESLAQTYMVSNGDNAGFMAYDLNWGVKKRATPTVTFSTWSVYNYVTLLGDQTTANSWSVAGTFNADSANIGATKASHGLGNLFTMRLINVTLSADAEI